MEKHQDMEEERGKGDGHQRVYELIAPPDVNF